MAPQRTDTVDRKRTLKVRARRRAALGRGAMILALAGSLVAGAFAMAVGMGSGDRSWLGWVSLLPLFVAIRWLSPWRAMLCGALWGVSLYGFSAYAVTAGIQPSVLSVLLLVLVPGLYV